MPKTIRLNVWMPDYWMRSLLKPGRRRPAPDFPYRIVGGEDTDILRPDGSLLASLRLKRLHPGVGWWRSLTKAVHWSENRQQLSGLVTRDYAWNYVSLLLQDMAKVLRAEYPAAYAQRIALPLPFFPNTPFTAAVVNRNAQFHVHRDRGNLPGLLEAMGVLKYKSWEGESYSGGYIAFPRYLIAIDMHHGDVLLADFRTEPHCNTPVISDRGTRFSVVGYCRPS